MILIIAFIVVISVILFACCSIIYMVKMERDCYLDLYMKEKERNKEDKKNNG